MSTFQIPGLPAGFSAESRVWIYQGDRPFTGDEAAHSRRLLTAFVDSWASHGTPVKGHAAILYNQFILLLADETASGVSGCSTDSSVRLIKEIEQQTGIRLFDRLNLAFLIDGQVRLIAMSALPEALHTGIVTPDTPYFNHTVQSKRELESNWRIALKDSWLGKKYLPQSSPATSPASK